MRRSPKRDPAALVTASLIGAFLATALATGGLLAGSVDEVWPGVALGVLSLLCCLLPASGVSTQRAGLTLAWVWTVGGPASVLLTHGLTRPQALLMCMGPLIALLLVGRRESVALAVVSLGAGFGLFAVQIFVGPQTSGIALQAEVDAALGLILCATVLVLAHHASTSRSRVLSQVREQASRTARWIGALPDTLLHVDAEGTIIDAVWRPPFSSQPPARGMLLTDRVPELRGLVGPLVRGAQRGVERVQLRLQRAPGDEREIELRAVGAQGSEVYLFARDVTVERAEEQRDREAERDVAREASETQLLQAGRLAHMGVLACGVAHEINNPLAYVMSNIQYLEEELETIPSKDNLRDAIRDAADGARRIRSIVEDIRMFSKADDSDHLELVQLAEVSRSAVRLVRFELRQRINLVEQHDGGPPVFANPSRLAQVIVNLLVNAIQAMPEDRATPGTITLRTGSTDAGEAFVEVMDDGVGIPEENRRRVFEPFFTTRPIGQGTGLGLSICYGLVRRLGGSVEVQSEVGAGSTFRIRLPDGQRLLEA